MKIGWSPVSRSMIAQPLDAQADLGVEEQAPRVGAAVLDQAAHMRSSSGRSTGSGTRQLAGDPAHRRATDAAHQAPPEERLSRASGDSLARGEFRAGARPRPLAERAQALGRRLARLLDSSRARRPRPSPERAGAAVSPSTHESPAARRIVGGERPAAPAGHRLDDADAETPPRRPKAARSRSHCDRSSAELARAARGARVKRTRCGDARGCARVPRRRRFCSSGPSPITAQRTARAAAAAPPEGRVVVFEVGVDARHHRYELLSFLHTKGSAQAHAIRRGLRHGNTDAVVDDLDLATWNTKPPHACGGRFRVRDVPRPSRERAFSRLHEPFALAHH